ncbi:hypothetical protein [Photobacterium phosphoreum]|uniref:hypothetical protein n=1 Tax=Photobacterium phosphoreum TaxID=659 RepID=UPI0024B65AD8|nr:hypothetical protein [Photobacterium phosphoreum]
MELKEINNTNRKQLNNILANNYKKEIKKITFLSGLNDTERQVLTKFYRNLIINVRGE